MRISIPNPCHEDWNQMTPEDKGRLCLSCQKTVVDFTKMNKTEIQQFFQTAVNEKVCGRIKASDLVQYNVLPEVHVYPNRFFVAPNHTPSRLFLMTVGLVFLYSCNTSPENFVQDPSESTQVLDVPDVDSNEIIIGDTVVLPKKKVDREEPLLLGEIVGETEHVIDKRTPNREPDCPPPPDEFFSSTNMPKLLPPNPLVGEIMGDVVEIDPVFPGGDAALDKFIKDNINYDTSKMIAGKVYVRFVVDTDGSVKNVAIARALSPANDAEAIRVVSMLPNFRPSYESGKARKTQMTIPIVFR